MLYDTMFYSWTTSSIESAKNIAELRILADFIMASNLNENSVLAPNVDVALVADADIAGGVRSARSGSQS